MWQTPAVDPELGLIYFSTGNASPDLDGGGRSGDNLYAASMVAWLTIGWLDRPDHMVDVHAVDDEVTETAPARG